MVQARAQCAACALQALVLAGFKTEESAMIRGVLDLANAHRLKLLPCTRDMLYLSLNQALAEPEIDWATQRPETLGRGREWGSQRVVLISGLK